MVGDSSDSAAVLMGMPEFAVKAAVEHSGEVWVLVETPARLVACAGCGTRAESKGRRRTCVRDLEVGGRPVVLVWDKRRWRCPDPDCEVASWSERTEAIAPRAVLTERARYEVFRRIGEEARSTAEVARAFGVGWATAWAAFEDHAVAVVDHPDRMGEVVALGIDETGFLAATAEHPRIFATGMVDVRNGRLCDVIEGRSGPVLRAWLDERAAEWLAGVEVVSIDPHEAYRSGLSPHLSHATVVADPFHIVRLANRADEVRRRVQDDTLGHRGRKADPLYRCRRLLTMADERLDDNSRAKLLGLLRAGDPRGEVTTSWHAKELVRQLYTHADPALALEWVTRLGHDLQDADCPPEIRRLGRTLIRWRHQIAAWHQAHVSNGPTEAVNNLIKRVKRVKRVAFGFSRFRNYRIRTLLYAGRPNWSLLATITPR